MQRALERAIAELIVGPELDPDDEFAVRAFLARHELGSADVEALMSRELRRLLVYRTLVRRSLFSALSSTIPRTIARLGALFDETFDRFLREHGPRSHYLRDLPDELVAWCAPQWHSDPRVPPYLIDLSRHEAVQIEIGSKKNRVGPAPLGGLALEHPLRFIEAVKLMRYAYAVHELSEELDDRTEPPCRPTSLLVYRSPEHEVRFLELGPLSATILEELLQAKPLGEALRTACERAGHPLSESVTRGAARLLSDLAERGALLGAERSEKV